MDVRHIIDDASHLAEQPQREWFIEMFIALIVMTVLMMYLDNRKPRPRKRRRPRHIETATIFKIIFGASLFVGCIATATYYMGVWHFPEVRPPSNPTKPWQQKHGTPPQN